MGNKHNNRDGKNNNDKINKNIENIDWEKRIKLIWKERNTTKNRLIRKIKTLIKNKIQHAIERLINSQESNPKAFYNKMRGDKNKKRGIEFVTYTKEGIVKIAHKWKRVVKRTEIFWA
eukprot:Phypoly_transcript_23006.p1 GENE.Phypoly_transcript_23006~~Phypoly_transcript_23006.p1  ORF type:complete len:118 (+),score=14.05 Phypoly_transcript_23006:167-520(+)